MVALSSSINEISDKFADIAAAAEWPAFRCCWYSWCAANGVRFFCVPVLRNACILGFCARKLRKLCKLWTERRSSKSSSVERKARITRSCTYRKKTKKFKRKNKKKNNLKINPKTKKSNKIKLQENIKKITINHTNKKSTFWILCSTCGLFAFRNIVDKPPLSHIFGYHDSRIQQELHKIKNVRFTMRQTNKNCF